MLEFPEGPSGSEDARDGTSMTSEESLEARARAAVDRACERYEARIASISPEARALYEWIATKEEPPAELKPKIGRRLREDRASIEQEVREMRKAFLDAFLEAAAEVEGS